MSVRPGHGAARGVSDAIDLARSAFELGLFEDPLDRPACLVVELDSGPDLARLNWLAPRLQCVVVGVAETPMAEAPDGFDVLLSATPGAPRPWVSCPDPDETADRLRVSAERSPQAAVALVELLRMSERLPVRDALVAESFVYSMLQGGPTFRGWLAGRSPRPEVRGGEGDPVLVTRERSVLRIVLNRPAVHNALDRAMRDALIGALQVAALDDSITDVTLSGAGPTFCSGGDLDEFGSAEDPATAHLVRIGRSVALAIHECAERVAVEVHGACVGAGIELPAFAGHVRARPGTTFSLPEVGFGLVPGAGGTAGIPRRVGRQRAAYMALSGTPLDATTALAWGLVDEIA